MKNLKFTFLLEINIMPLAIWQAKSIKSVAVFRAETTGSKIFSAATDLYQIFAVTGLTPSKYFITTTLSSSGTTITHNLNTNYITYAIWDSTGNPIVAQVLRTSVNTISISAATTGTYDIVVHG